MKSLVLLVLLGCLGVSLADPACPAQSSGVLSCYDSTNGAPVQTNEGTGQMCYTFSLQCSSTAVSFGFCSQDQVGMAVTAYGSVSSLECSAVELALDAIGWNGQGLTLCTSNNCNAPPSSPGSNLVKPIAGLLVAAVAAVLI